MRVLMVLIKIFAISRSVFAVDERVKDEDRYETTTARYQYFDKMEQKLFYYVWAGNRGFFSPVADNSTAVCPPNSKSRLKNKMGVLKVCECEPGFTPSIEFRHCVQERYYSESCDASNPCSARASLTCNSGTCQCPEDAVWEEQHKLCYSDRLCSERERTLVYDPKSPKKCIRILGSLCDLTMTKDEIGCPEKSFCQSLDEFYAETHESVDSSSYAICRCDKGLAASRDQRKCFLAANIGESCADENTICLPGLTCLNNTVCGCKDELVWDKNMKECKVAAGKSCIRFSLPWCVEGSECRFEGHGSKTICKCKFEYSELDGFCYARYTGKCSISEQCEPDLECIDGLCTCPSPINQVFDASTGYVKNSSRCQGLPDASCSSFPICTKKAHCIDGTCKCASGYSKTLDRRCLKSYQTMCKEEQCNFSEGLACIHGTCSCFDPTLTFVNGTGCVSQVGSPCGNLKALKDCPPMTGCPSYFVSCETPAYCNARGYCELDSKFIN